MTKRVTELDALLARVTEADPALGRTLRDAGEVWLLALGRGTWNAWQLGEFYQRFNYEQEQIIEQVLRRLDLPLLASRALLSRGRTYYAPPAWLLGTQDPTERLERVTLDGLRLDLHFSAKGRRYRLALIAPPLSPARATQARAWLSDLQSLRKLAHGHSLPESVWGALGLLPRWDELTRAEIYGDPPVELAAKCLAAVLAYHPGAWLVWRGLGGPAVVDAPLAALVADYAENLTAALAQLPEDPAAFWDAPPLPDLAAVIWPSGGWAGRLPTPDLWEEPEDNARLANVLDKVYQAVPRRLAKLTGEET